MMMTVAMTILVIIMRVIYVVVLAINLKSRATLSSYTIFIVKRACWLAGYLLTNKQTNKLDAKEKTRDSTLLSVTSVRVQLKPGTHGASSRRGRRLARSQRR